MVNSDFKNNRVGDPTKIDDKQQKKVKKFCKEFFDKAVAKHRAYERRKTEQQSKGADSKPDVEDEALDVKMSDDEDYRAPAQDEETPTTMTDELQGNLKRKREDEPSTGDGNTTEYTTPSSSKRQRSSTPPPPPPPPPMSPSNELAQSGDDSNMKSDTDEPTPADKPPFDSPPPPPPLPPFPGQKFDSEENDFSSEEGVNELNPSHIGIEGQV